MVNIGYVKKLVPNECHVFLFNLTFPENVTETSPIIYRRDWKGYVKYLGRSSNKNKSKSAVEN